MFNTFSSLKSVIKYLHVMCMTVFFCFVRIVASSMKAFFSILFWNKTFIRVAIPFKLVGMLITKSFSYSFLVSTFTYMTEKIIRFKSSVSTSCSMTSKPLVMCATKLCCSLIKFTTCNRTQAYIRTLLWMFKFVFAPRENFKIFNSVISFIMVNMVNSLTKLEFSIKKLLHYISMFINLFVILVDYFISVIHVTYPPNMTFYSHIKWKSRRLYG